MRRPLLVLLLALGLLSPLASAVAQDKPAAAPATRPGLTAEDPTDRIVAHIQSMTDLIKANKTTPDKLVSEFEAYIGDNKTAMRKANKDFEARIKVMPADEAQRYQEGLQRKLEGPMKDFLTEMLDLQKRHPDKAKALDERLYKATQDDK